MHILYIYIYIYIYIYEVSWQDLGRNLLIGVKILWILYPSHVSTSPFEEDVTRFFFWRLKSRNLYPGDEGRIKKIICVHETTPTGRSSLYGYYYIHIRCQRLAHQIKTSDTQTNLIFDSNNSSWLAPQVIQYVGSEHTELTACPLETLHVLTKRHSCKDRWLY